MALLKFGKVAVQFSSRSLSSSATENGFEIRRVLSDVMGGPKTGRKVGQRWAFGWAEWKQNSEKDHVNQWLDWRSSWGSRPSQDRSYIFVSSSDICTAQKTNSH